MKFSALPPVYRPVPLKPGHSGSRESIERFFADRKVTLYASGTAALAAAIAHSVAHRSARTPEVIIPAYGCPDLVAACLHASVYPRLVDVAPSYWAYDAEALKSSLSSNTVAIVAVNLLGIGDGSAELISLCRDRHIALIQDSAQHLPRDIIEWTGDYVVLSFGRGKPLNLLHGGALISSRGDRNDVSVQSAHLSLKTRLLSSPAAAIAFNTLTHPVVYKILSSLPATGLGRVIYKPLTNSTPMPEPAVRRVATAFSQYRKEPSYRRSIWIPTIEEWSELGIFAYTCRGSHVPAEPLRLLLLAPNRVSRDTLVDSLKRAGLGASRLYDVDLPHVAEIPDVVRKQGPFPNASTLADRVFTLPTHAMVNANTVRATRELVLAWHRSRQVA